jgi:hypothetical protein
MYKKTRSFDEAGNGSFKDEISSAISCLFRAAGSLNVGQDNNIAREKYPETLSRAALVNSSG